MRLAGFNGRDVREGTCDRGNKKSPEPDPKEKQPTKIRGPVCPEFISSFIVAIAGAALEKLFNGVVGILAAHSFFPKNIHAIPDASEIQSTEECEGRGRVKKEKAPSLRNRKNRIRKVYVIVFGFKIWVVWDPQSRLPLVMRFAKINVDDTKLAREVIEQAITNMGESARIVSIALDRWEVVGLEGLTSAGFYGELGSGSHQNRKNFVANPINAVVVLHDPYKENNPDCKTMVILTNDSVKKPL